MFGYESPITVLQKQIETQLEGEILKAVHKVGVVVDKEELVKALKCDREQYEKGFEDGCVSGVKECCQRIIERLKDSAIGARDSKDLSKFSAYFQAIEIVEEEGGLND